MRHKTNTNPYLAKEANMYIMKSLMFMSS